MSEHYIQTTQKSLPTSDQVSDLLSRDQVLKKIKTITETVKSYQKQRLKTFFSSKALKSMLEPKQPILKTRKEQRRSSQLIAFKTLDPRVDSSQNLEISEETSSFTSESESSLSEAPVVLHFPRVELKFEMFFQELVEAKSDFDTLDLEFFEKARVKSKMRSSQSILPGDMSIFTQTGCRSYVKIAKECYEGEEIQFSRSFLSISLEELQIFHTARDKTPEFRMDVAEIKEIIDENDGKIKLIYIYKDFDTGMIINPITSADSVKWTSTFKNVSKIKSIIYKSEGTLPVKRDEEPQSALLRHRNTIYPKFSVNYTDGFTDRIDESREESLETDKEDLESTEKSWDFDFEELDREEEVKEIEEFNSVTSDEHVNFDDEKTRSLTVLANLGISEGLVNLLTKGGLFLKYGRWGKPHMRHILVTADLKHVEWWHLNKNKASGNIMTINILSVQTGRNTKNFKRFKRPDMENLSFSLVCKNRSIDLEVAKDNKTSAEVWVMAFESLLKHQFKRDQVVRYITKKSTIKE